MSLLFDIYKAILPKPVFNALAPLQQKVHTKRVEWLKQHGGSERSHQRRLARWRKLLAGDRPVRVAFQVAQLSKWKCESLLQLMLQDSRFEPFIWSVPVSGVLHLTNPQAHEQEVRRVVNAFSERGIRVCTYSSISKFPAEERPDLIFIHEAYDAIFPSESYRGLTRELLCYVPYAYRNTSQPVSLNGIGNNIALFCFCENEATREDVQRIAANGGCNTIVSGHPMADVLAAAKSGAPSVWKDCGKPMKKVIWAPHWTIYPGTSWYLCGTFLKNAEAMLALAKKYADEIQFAFKPHPHLYRTLCALPEWGEERTKDYYRQWAEMPNTQLEEGEYTELFMQSDGMIHDSGSFILEYLFADKPCLFLEEGEGYPGYNRMSREALNAYHFGLTGEDIENFLRTCILSGEDSKAEIRHEVLHTYLLPPGGLSAAENIYKTLCGA